MITYSLFQDRYTMEQEISIFLEAKASKGMHQVCNEKPPDRYVFIHPR